MENTKTAEATKTTKWTLDPTHSELTFKVKHLMITSVKGSFREFDAQIESLGTDFNNARTLVTIDASSVDTNNADRDGHLRSADFFDSVIHPEIKFESTGLTKLDDDNYQLEGQLTIKGINKEVVLDVEFGGLVKDPYG